MATTGAVPDPRLKGVDTPKPSAPLRRTSPGNTAKSIGGGGTGVARYLPSTNKPAR